ncbi:10633_t:CDS:1 [Ambispora leptoticha]|uniref:10633_t:CDS:1 n=1 Tax=Ambispora leptoticha TaxID=144679 RepID=A0A9N8Z220_9GLOM|nr:10633_t:CDS:1 [Ambispora leptoticha]
MNGEEIQTLAELLLSYVVQLQPCESFINDLCEIYLKKGEDLKVLENRFFIFKRFIRKQLKNGGDDIPRNLIISTRDQTKFAKVISITWKKLSLEQQSVYQEIREEVKLIYTTNYPNWKSNQNRNKATLKIKRGREIMYRKIDP